MAAASSAGAESKPPADAVAGKRRRLRVPTSLLVTLLGIALSAWLAPAITRQWEDRKKAQELKASLIAEMAVANARALAVAQGGLLRTKRFTPSRQDRTQASLNRWSIESLTI